MLEDQQIEIDPVCQQLVLEQRYRLYDSLNETNSNMDGRINNLVQAGSIIIGLVVVLNLPTISGTYDMIVFGTMRQKIQLLFLVLVFLSFISMIILSIYVLRPVSRKAPGISDWDETFTYYLYSDNCFEQVLSDLLESIKSAQALNDYKVKWVPRLAYLLIIQAFFLALAIFFA